MNERCEKCGRPVTKHVGPLSTVVQHDDTGRVSCTAAGLGAPTVTPIPHQLRCPKCESYDVECSRSNRNRTHTHRCSSCGHEAVFGATEPVSY